MLIEDIFTSQPSAILDSQNEMPCIAVTKSDNATLLRQSCMYSASGELNCDNSRKDGQHMIVEKPCSKPPNGYTF